MKDFSSIMRGQTSLPVLLVLLCASNGWTQSTNPPSPAPEAYRCIKREGIPVTVLIEEFMIYLNPPYFLEPILHHLSARFPCITRRYTTVLLNSTDPKYYLGDIVEIKEAHEVTTQTRKTIESITYDQDKFLKSITGNKEKDKTDDDGLYNRMSECNQSFLYGLKRALEVSPDESIIITVTSGSMTDDQDTRLLSDIYTLLKEKKSQVYVVLFWGFCRVTSSQQDLFRKLPSVSFGEFFSGFSSRYLKKFIHSMELLLARPLNSTLRILDLRTNDIDTYTGTFNVNKSTTFLLIAGDDTFTLNFTEANGNRFVFEKQSMDYNAYTFFNYRLVKSPPAGTWTLNAQGSGELKVRILGITGWKISGNCSDSDCHPNATCGEFGGDQQCTCREGFAGDGFNCTDIDECRDHYAHNCYDYGGTCVNTVGSFTCTCSAGLEFKAGVGCVDIDECADNSQNNCHALAVCTNFYKSYSCRCPDRYYGDGKYCEVNECLQGAPCKSDEECIKYNGSYSCMDPCSNHTVLNDSWRSTSNVHSYFDFLYFYDWPHCDYGLYGWYRLNGEYGQRMPEYCVPKYSCGTYSPMWMNGSHPAIEGRIVNRTACANWNGNCCFSSTLISVKKCSEGYYVYKLQGVPIYYSAYCVESGQSCSGMECAPGEQCRIVDGVQECHCRNASYITSGMQPGFLPDYIKPQVICGPDNIEVKFSKCLLEKTEYDTSSIHLKDNCCQGVIKKTHTTYIVLNVQPIHGDCGGNISHTDDVVTYTNTAYLTPKPKGVALKEEYTTDFFCSYPKYTGINLPTVTGAGSLAALATINVDGRSYFTIMMALFQDSGYSTPYTGSEVWLDSSSVLYVAAVVTGFSGSSRSVLLMKNCYTTPTSDSTYSPGCHEVIKDGCPNQNQSSISVSENGVSLKGRFSLQVFNCSRRLAAVYLHCQVVMYDPSRYNSARCPSEGFSAVDRLHDVKTLSVGPIKYKDLTNGHQSE